MRTIAFCNHKGGVGKTTSTASVGVAMARQGKKVLLVDLDGQANLTGIFVSPENIEKSIYDSLVDKQPLPIHKIEKNLDLVPSDLNMSAAEVKMSGLFNREMRLTHFLAKVKDSYDEAKPELAITGVFITCFDSRKNINKAVEEEVRKQYVQM